MNFSTKLLKTFKNLPIKLHFSTLIREELTVQTFCDVNVNVPYNVRVKPLDVHKYHNCDLLKIELEGTGERKTIKHVQDGNNIKIFATSAVYDRDTTCHIHAPVKANLNIEAQGDITTGVFSGPKLILKSAKGNIFVDKFQGETIDLNTDCGDIILKGAVVASNIKLTVTQNGSIKTKRVQGSNALLQTKEGNISVESSYCENGVFESSTGDLNLQNLHKNCKILLKNGKLNLSGLDGQICAELQNASADIHISRILEDSTITMSEGGDLKLLLSDYCQDNTLFEVVTDDHVLDPSVRSIPSTNKTTLYLMPTTQHYKNVLVKCEGRVYIQSASWINMLKLGVKKD